MTMPKGYRSSHGYATVKTNIGGLGYREIAEKMSEDGFKMNHSTARNIFLGAMSKLAREACMMYEVSPNSANLKKISSDPRFQSGIFDILSE
tara:strand:- start:4236 stop:4511 length:276 start_codon:yes stop_codon:yes gene_type:complete